MANPPSLQMIMAILFPNEASIRPAKLLITTEEWKIAIAALRTSLTYLLNKLQLPV